MWSCNRKTDGYKNYRIDANWVEESFIHLSYIEAGKITFSQEHVGQTDGKKDNNRTFGIICRVASLLKN